MYNRLHMIPACNRQTDGRTDGQTDRQTSCHGIVRAMHTRRAVKIVNFIPHLYLSPPQRVTPSEFREDV